MKKIARNVSRPDKKNRYYEEGEIDIVAACLYSRTLKWEFLYAWAKDLNRHDVYENRYSQKLQIEPGKWVSDFRHLLGAV